MLKKFKPLTITLFIAPLAVFLTVIMAMAGPEKPGDRLTVAGAVKNLQGRGVKEVKLEVLVKGQPLKPAGPEDEIITGKSGSFLAEFVLPPDTLKEAKVEITAAKPSWREIAPTEIQVIEAGRDAHGNTVYQGVQNFTMYRAITPAFWIAATVLLLVYVIIAAEWMHRALAALLGAALVMFISYTLGTFNKEYFILSFEDAMRAIDMNVIFLLMGMMIIVGVLKKTGLFQWLAFKSYALARGTSLSFPASSWW